MKMYKHNTSEIVQLERNNEMHSLLSIKACVHVYLFIFSGIMISLLNIYLPVSCTQSHHNLLVNCQIKSSD